MVRSAARLTPRLLAELERLDDGSIPVAELCRLLGKRAETLGLPRPSYERVRVLISELRRRPSEPSTGEVLADIAFRVRPPFLDHISGVGVPKKPL